MILDREAILAKTRLPIETVEVPDWGTVCVRVMTAAERDEFERNVLASRSDSNTPPPNFRARLVVKTLTDADGKPLFTEADVDDVGRLSSVAIGHIFDAAMRINRMGDGGEDIAGNSEATHPGDSSSG